MHLLKTQCFSQLTKQKSVAWNCPLGNWVVKYTQFEVENKNNYKQKEYKSK